MNNCILTNPQLPYKWIFITININTITKYNYISKLCITNSLLISKKIENRIENHKTFYDDKPIYNKKVGVIFSIWYYIWHIHKLKWIKLLLMVLEDVEDILDIVNLHFILLLLLFFCEVRDIIYVRICVFKKNIICSYYKNI